MKILSTLFFIVLLLLGSSKQGRSQDAIYNADKLFYDLNLISATESYQKILQNDKANSKEKALACLKLAYIDFHFNNNIDATRIYLKKALEFNEYKVYVFKDLIKYENLDKNFENAKKEYKNALSLLKTEDNIQLVTIEYSDMALNEAFDNIKNKLPLDTMLLYDALEEIRTVNKQNPGILRTAKIQLSIAMLLQEGEIAIEAWDLYYNVSNNQKAEVVLSKAHENLVNILSNWEKSNSINENRDQLIINVAASRFYELAYYLNLYLPKSNCIEKPEITDISNYYQFCKEIETSIFQYYRKLAISGKNSNRQIKKDIKSIQKRFWKKLNKNDEGQRYSKDRFYEVLYNKFGSKIYSGNFAGNYFLIGGHSVIDKSLTVEQYGHKDIIQFVLLDTRFSNNYWGWYTGYYGFSGYANGEIIARYREPVASNPINYWNKLNNEKQFIAWKKEVADLSKQNDSMFSIEPYHNLSSIYERIRLNIYTEILDSLKSSGLTNDNLRKAFISTLNQIEYEHIINHEGRHAIDFNTLSKIELQNNTELEFRATLSQIYFSKYPLLDIRFEVNSTPHGLANKKLLNIISNWMEQNQDRINDLNINRPILLQIDLLTNKQIREIIESVEPFITNNN